MLSPDPDCKQHRRTRWIRLGCQLSAANLAQNRDRGNFLRTAVFQAAVRSRVHHLTHMLHRDQDLLPSHEVRQFDDSLRIADRIVDTAAAAADDSRIADRVVDTAAAADDSRFADRVVDTAAAAADSRIADRVVDTAAAADAAASEDASADAGPDDNNLGGIAAGSFAVDNEECRNSGRNLCRLVAQTAEDIDEDAAAADKPAAIGLVPAHIRHRCCSCVVCGDQTSEVPA